MHRFFPTPCITKTHQSRIFPLFFLDVPNTNCPALQSLRFAKAIDNPGVSMPMFPPDTRPKLTLSYTEFHDFHATNFFFACLQVHRPPGHPIFHGGSLPASGPVGAPQSRNLGGSAGRRCSARSPNRISTIPGVLG